MTQDELEKWIKQLITEDKLNKFYKCKEWRHDVPYTRAVRAASYWPVRDMDNIYENDMLMTEYSIFTPYMGDYYQITPEWAKARTAWWQLLAKIGEGTDISEAVKDFPSQEY